MARKEITSSWDRENRSNIDNNFKELYNEYTGAGLTASEAKQKALEAINKSDQALSKSEQTQIELDQAILKGDSSPLGGQLSVGAGGKVYSSPQERLLKENETVTSLLAQKADDHTVRKKTELIGLNDADSELIAAIQNKVGETTFNLESIPRDFSVSPVKTTFMKQTRNLFSGDYQVGVLTPTGTPTVLRYRKLITGFDGRVAVVPLEPNATYTVKIHEPSKSNVFRIGIVNSYPEIQDAYQDTNTFVISNDSLKQHTFTNTADGRYAMIYVSNAGQEPKLQVEKGTTATEFVEGLQIPSNFLEKRKMTPDDLENGMVTLPKLSFTQRSNKNIFDGNYIEAVLVSVSSPFTIRYRREIPGFSGRTAIVPIEPNATYTVKIHEPEKSNVFRIGIMNSYPTIQEAYQDANAAVVDNNALKEYTFTNTANGKYAMIYVSNSGQTPLMQVEKGDTATSFENYYVIPKELLEVKGTSESGSSDGAEGFGIYFNKMLTQDFNRPELGYITTTEGGFDLQSTNSQYIYDKYDALMAAYPDYISRRLLGYAGTASRTEDTTLPIYEYYFKPKRPDTDDAQVPLLLIDSGIHGYEKQAVWVTYKLFEHICNNHETDEVAEFLRYNIDFRVIPVSSPYSYDNNQRYTATGTDPNTNFDTGWQKEGSPGQGTYSGEAPMTELETRLLDRWFNEFHNQAFSYINMHNTQGVNTTSEGRVGICWVITPVREIRTLERSILSDYSRKWWKEFPKLQNVPYNTMFGFVNERTAGTARNQAFNKYGIKSVTLDPDRNLSQPFPGTIYNGKEGYLINMDLLGATVVGLVRNFAK